MSLTHPDPIAQPRDNVIAFPDSPDARPAGDIAPGVTVFCNGYVTRYASVPAYERAILAWADEQRPPVAEARPIGDEVMVIHAGRAKLYSSPEAFAEVVETAQAARRRLGRRAWIALWRQRLVTAATVLVIGLVAAWVVGPHG